MEKNTVAKRIQNLLLSNIWRFSKEYSYDNIKKWHNLKKTYKGKRCFLIANGPSLNITPLYLLKDEYTIMFNRAGLITERLNFFPSFYMITDNLVANNIKVELNNYIEKCKIFFAPDITKFDLSCLRDFIPYKNNVYYLYEEPIRFSHHLPFVNVGGTVIYAAFQALLYMGFDEVIVVGNDMNYQVVKNVEVLSDQQSKGMLIQDIKSTKDDDPNHFDPRYFGKGKVYHQPNKDVVNHIFESLDVVAKEFSNAGIRIVNAGYNSAVKSFPREDFYDALGYTSEHIEYLFEDLVKHLGFNSLSNFLSKVEDSEGLWNGEKQIISVPLDKTSSIVKEKILDYLPIGPYNDRTYFINRKLI